MSFRRLFAAALALLVVIGCAPDTMAPGGDRPQAEAPGLTPLGAPSASDLRADLIELGRFVTPNDQSILSKFDALVAAQGAGTGFGDELEDLISKINLEVQKYTGSPRNGSLDDCVDGTNNEDCLTVEGLRDQIIADIYRFVGLDPDGTICIVPPGAPSSFCETEDTNAGFVYFPPALFDRLTYVSVKALENSNVFSGLDEYGTTIEIRTAPISDFDEIRPTVVACVPTTLSEEVLNRLLLGHRRSVNAPEYGGNPPFSLLPEADLGFDPALVNYAAGFCGTPEPLGSASGPSIFGLAADSPLNRLLVSARDFLLPSELAASNAVLLAARGFSGASGSPEEFSTFRAVDRGVTGAGGSPEEFAPQASTGAANAAASGMAGTSATSGLPSVRVRTVGDRGVNGVKVSFTLTVPASEDAEGTPLYPGSQASLCSASPVTVTTAGEDDDGAPLGLATLPCLNFGDRAGYMNLQVTFDPSDVLTGDGFAPGEELCIIETDPVTPGVNADAPGACDTDGTVTQNFLIETVAGPAAAIEIVEGDNQTAPAYSAVAIAPKVVVKDQYGNLVSGAEVDWSANVGTIDPNLGTGQEDFAQTTTGADGTSALTSWTLGVGANTLLAEIATSSGIESVTFNATGTFGLSLANACVTGGAKDDITKYGFHFPSENGRLIQAIGLHLSSNGAPGLSENYEVTLTATRTVKQGSTTTVENIRQATARLQSGSNSSKGLENLVVFDFVGNPFPALPNGSNGTVSVTMTVAQIVNGVSQALPANRSVNMNVGGCPAGSKNCKPVKVAEARACSITESQLSPYIENYRNGLAARVYTSP